MNSFYFEKMHMLYMKIIHVWSRVKNIAFFKKTPSFSKKPIGFQHVHFFIPLFWNEKLSLFVYDKNYSSF